METLDDKADIEIYKAVRAHEVMLNQAVSAFEHAVYTRLAALNGGAAAAFVTLLGTQIKSDGSQLVSVGPAVVAVLSWIFGLLAASIAAVFGFRRQRAINHGYRLLREEAERKLGHGELANVVSAGRTNEEDVRLQEFRETPPSREKRKTSLGEVHEYLSPKKRKEKKDEAQQRLKNAEERQQLRRQGHLSPQEQTMREDEKFAENRDLRKAYSADAGKELARFNCASGISVGLFIVGAIAALIAVVV